ncbi:MAG: amidase family protein [Firmicutes bacterium]|nr:amidase family protein [Bacillota bacterium]
MKEKTVLLEDSIMIKSLPCTAGSKMLSNFLALFDACVVEKLKKEKFELLPVALSEFSLEDFCGKKTKEVIGSIEGNSLLCNDFSGNVRKFLKEDQTFLYPTYGRVSRYGLIPSVSSMDRIGILAKSSGDAFKLLEIISGHDSRDGMSVLNSEYKIPQDARKLKITKFSESFENTDAVYSILSAAEFANNISRYDGIKFGYRADTFKGLNELYIKSRSEGLCADAKLKAILGNIVLSENYYQKYYDKAMRIRRLIKHKAENLLKNCDVLEILNPKNSDFLLSPLTGCPSLTFIKNGVQTIAIAKQMDEDALYAYAKEVKI